LSLVTAIKQLSKYSKWVLQAAATHKGLVSQEVNSFVALVLRVFFESCCRRSGAVRLPFETEGTTNGREQFRLQFERK
jgi:hypothetical protein